MKRIFTLFLVLSMMFLSGCSAWMNGERLSVTPHENKLYQASGEIFEAETYVQMQEALIDKIEAGSDNMVVSVAAFAEATADADIQSAVEYVKNSTPIGAYAVKEITYEIGKNRGQFVIAFHMEYHHGIGELIRIKSAANMDEATMHITNALTECTDSLVFMVNNYEETDLVQLVADYANDNPDKVMEQPQVRVSVYPDMGDSRIVEIYFTYQTRREELRKMRDQVEAVFTSARLYVRQTTVKETYSRLYSFLMERNEYTIGTSITPAYSLLHHAVGDSRAFANVYSAMCRREGLDCRVISGTKKGEKHFWNVIRYRGEYYHVDLLECSKNGDFKMLKDSDMSDYIWDYSA